MIFFTKTNILIGNKVTSSGLGLCVQLCSGEGLGILGSHAYPCFRHMGSGQLQRHMPNVYPRRSSEASERICDSIVFVIILIRPYIN